MRCFSPHLIDICAVNVIQVAAGGKHTLVLKASGQIVAFGKGDKGQLGQGSFSSSSIPVTIKPPAGGVWKQIAAGGEHSLAIFESTDSSATQLYSPFSIFMAFSIPVLQQPVVYTFADLRQVRMGIKRVFKYGRRPRQRVCEQGVLAPVQELLPCRTFERGR
jgi:hypothetical protein